MRADGWPLCGCPRGGRTSTRTLWFPSLIEWLIAREPDFGMSAGKERSKFL